MDVVLTHATVIDLVHPDPVEDATITIRDGRITDVSNRNNVPSSTKGYNLHDLSGYVVMPGLWDAHAHLAHSPDPTKRPPLEPPADRTVRAGRNAIDALRGGITAIRVVGEADGVDIAWKHAFETGVWCGPRLFVCGAALACTGGHATRTGLAVECDGAEGFRRAAREQLERGADQIKLMVTGGIGSSLLELPDDVELTIDEVRAAVEVAHARGRLVSAHVGAAAGAKLALRAGVDCIEHGYLLDEEAVELMNSQKAYYVPTLRVTQLEPERYVSMGRSALVSAKAARVAPSHLRSFHLALEKGVRICSGEDGHTILPNAYDEIELLARCGMRPYDALIAATRTPAALCGMSEQLGSLEAGKLGDLIILPRNPLDDISAIREPVGVVKEGQLVAGTWP